MSLIKNGVIFGPSVTSITAETNKIDGEAVDGLLGVHNSLAYKVTEIERHFHSSGRWFEKATTPNGTIHVADRIGVGAGPIRIDAANNDWGAWVQVLGSTDTPIKVGNAYFDPHQVVIDDVERANAYFVQFARGDTGDAGFTAGNYTEFVYDAASNKDTAIIHVQTGRAPAGSLLWARCKITGVDTGWMDFYFGLHEYEG